jgi:phosphoserine phosphatase
MSGGVEKLMARGVSKRAALHRIARKHGVNPRSVYALIARAEWIEGGAA